jgi:uncharacterized protein YuzE
LEITYDPKVRAVYIYVSGGKIAKTRSIGRYSRVIVDSSADEHVCGIEILNVRECPVVVAPGHQQPTPRPGGESQGEEIARLRVALEEAAAFWRPVARDPEHDILSIDSVRFLAQDFLAMLQPTLKSGGE